MDCFRSRKLNHVLSLNSSVTLVDLQNEIKVEKFRYLDFGIILETEVLFLQVVWVGAPPHDVVHPRHIREDIPEAPPLVFLPAFLNFFSLFRV